MSLYKKVKEEDFIEVRPVVGDSKFKFQIVLDCEIDWNCFVGKHIKYQGGWFNPIKNLDQSLQQLICEYVLEDIERAEWYMDRFVKFASFKGKIPANIQTEYKNIQIQYTNLSKEQKQKALEEIEKEEERLKARKEALLNSAK